MPRTLTRDAAPETFKALLAFDGAITRSLGPVLFDLVKLRASQLNGCAYCVDTHSAELERHGVPSRKLHNLPVWRESPFFDETERVALAFTEALTGGVDEIDDALWDDAGRLLGDEKRANLVMAVGAINTFNMSGITTHLRPQHDA